MRVAALYDIHGNLPALEAVLAEVEAENPDLIVVGGDVAFGPMPSDTTDRLRALGASARFIMGNTDRALIEAFDQGSTPADTGDPLDCGACWAAQRLSQSQRDFMAGFAPRLELDFEGYGSVLFCHGSPRSDEDSITARTGDDRLRPMLAGVEQSTVVCGHTHHQFDRHVLGKRLVNAGSVGMPYQGEAAAFWLLLEATPTLRRTDYDIAAAVTALRATGFPAVDEVILKKSLLHPISPEAVWRFSERRAAAPG